MTEAYLDLFQALADMLDVRVEQPRSYKSYTDTCTNKQIAPSFFKKKFITLLGASDSIVLLGDCTSMAEEIILRNKLWENREVTGKKKTTKKKTVLSTKRWAVSSCTAATVLISATTDATNVLQPLSSSRPSDGQLVDKPQATNTSEWEITACSYNPNN